MEKINSIIRPIDVKGTEINISLSLNDQNINIEKMDGFIPTSVSVRTISDILTGIIPNSPKRTRLITGQYGTGKSYLGLVLANLLGADFEELTDSSLIKKINQKNREDTKTALRNRETISKPYFIVLPDPGSSNFSNTMLKALDSAIRNKNVDYIPNTYYQEAIQQIDKFLEDKLLAERFCEYLEESKYINVEMLRKRLEAFDQEAYEICGEAIEATTMQSFSPTSNAKSGRVFKEFSKHLCSNEGYAGIVVIFDEFGRQLTEMAKDPDGNEAADIQNFVEVCNASRENQIHFIAIAHRSLADYARGNENRLIEEWKKVSGRFEEHNIDFQAGTEYEIVDVLSSLIQVDEKSGVYKKYWSEISKGLVSHTDWAISSKLFGEEILQYSSVEAVIKETYPFHPSTILCLPWLSQKLGQEKRTSYKLLSANQQGGFNDFLKGTNIFSDNDRLSLYTPDILLDYFYDSAKQNSEYRDLIISRDAIIAKLGSASIAPKIIDLITILTIAGRPQLSATTDNIVEILKGYFSEESISNVLQSLKDGETLHYNIALNVYDIPMLSQGGVSVSDAIEAILETESRNFNLAEELSKFYKKEELIARGYSEKFYFKRKAKIEISHIRELANIEHDKNRLKTKLNSKNIPYEGDALIKLLVSDSEDEIKNQEAALVDGTGSDLLIIGYPKGKFRFSEELKNLFAHKKLRIFGYKIKDKQVVESLANKSSEELRGFLIEEIAKYFSPSNFYWYYGKNKIEFKNNLYEKNLEDLLSQIFLTTFSKTPALRDDALYVDGRDNQKGPRSSAISKLIEIDGNIRLNETDKKLSPEDRIIRQVYRETGFFEFVKDLGGSKEYRFIQVIPKTSVLSDVWKILLGRIKSEDEETHFDDLFEKIYLPPYGITPQMLEIILAGALRLVKKNSRVFEQGKTPSDMKLRSFDVALVRDIIEKPEKYILIYFNFNPTQMSWLNHLAHTFSIESYDESVVNIKIIEDGIKKWFLDLPLGTKQSKDLSRNAADLLVILEEWGNNTDFSEIVFEGIPELFGKSFIDNEKSNEDLNNLIGKTVNQIEKHYHALKQTTIERIGEVFGAQGKTQEDVKKAVNIWFSELPEATRINLFSEEEGELMKTISDNESSFEELYFNLLPRQLGLNELSTWDNLDKIEVYASRLQNIKDRVEFWTPAQGESKLDDSEIDFEKILVSEIIKMLGRYGNTNNDLKIKILEACIEEIKK